MLSIVLLSESHASTLLDVQACKMREQTGLNDQRAGGSEHTSSRSVFLNESVHRPVAFLHSEPLVLSCAILCSIAFALFYGSTQSLKIMYTDPRLTPAPFSKTSSSLPFIAVPVGLILNILPRFYDAHMVNIRGHKGQPIMPKCKIRSFAVTCPALAIGLWIFGWTTPPLVLGVHWMFTMIGLVLIGFAVNDFAVVLSGYISDSYGPSAASAASLLTLTRTIAAAVFPLFIPQIYERESRNYSLCVDCYTLCMHSNRFPRVRQNAER